MPLAAPLRCCGHAAVGAYRYSSTQIHADAMATPSRMRAYRNRGPSSVMEPHGFLVADRAFVCMVEQRRDQAVLICGESGSGKTETCKYVLRHLAFVSKDLKAALGSKSSQELGRLLVKTNPLLEAFGNAETVLNKNSSRFGKHMELLLTSDGLVSGARVRTYWLERTRVATPPVGRERNYHVFYYLAARGLLPGGKPANAFRCLRTDAQPHIAAGQ